MSARIHHAVSLFSNCGAGDTGYAKAGFHFEVMAELDPRRLEVCRLNHPKAGTVPGDLRETWPDVVAKYKSRVGKTRPSLLAACPPCQGMSTARSERGRESDPDAGMRDERNLLVTVIANVAEKLRPRLIVVENVQAFLTRQVRHPETNRPISAARLLIEYLAEDYEAFPLLTNLCLYGVPQTRKRAFLTFIHRDENSLEQLRALGRAPYPAPLFKGRELESGPIKAREALVEMRLPSLDAASAETATSHIAGGLHSVPVWEDRRYAMVAAIPPHSGGSAWENSTCSKSCGKVVVTAEDAECPKCGSPLLRPVIAKARGGFRLITGFRTSTYSRMRSDRPAATVTTASGHIGSNNTIHPFENRVLSTYECALLQTFPRRFKWGDALKKWGHTNVREMIGEAVPPLFTRAHGRVLCAILEGRLRVRMSNANDLSSVKAARKLGLPVRTVKTK